MDDPPTYTFRSRDQDGTINEVESTPEQALDLGSGRAIAYWPHDEKILVDDAGQIIKHESAIPVTSDD